jgi:acyl-CoA synthetase (AMP-forming)/AMP-acid ligase II
VGPPEGSPGGLPMGSPVGLPVAPPVGLMSDQADRVVAWRLQSADANAPSAPEPQAIYAAQLWSDAQQLSERLSARSRKSGIWLLAAQDPYEVLLGCLAVWGIATSQASLGQPPEQAARPLQVAFPPSLLPKVILGLAEQLGAGVLYGQDWRDKLPAELPSEPIVGAASMRSGEAWAVTTSARLAELHDCSAPIAQLFTSGTTGTPQGSAKTARQLLGEAQLQARLFFGPAAASLGITTSLPIGSEDARSVLCCVPVHHIFGLLFGVLVPFYAGAGLWSTPERAPAWSLKPHLPATDLVSVPAQLGSWSPSLHPAPSLQRVFCSGAPLPSSVASRWAHDFGLELIELFGSTETGGIAWRRNDPTSPWLPLPGVEVKSDAEARLVLRSPFAPQANGETFTTQDRVRMQGAGFIHLGREGDVVKLGGKRLALSELEHFVQRLPGVVDAAAIAVDDPGLRGRAIWLLVAAPSPHWTERELRGHLSQHFEGVVLPRRIRFVASLPRNAAGKLPRESLLQQFDAQGGAEPSQGK